MHESEETSSTDSKYTRTTMEEYRTEVCKQGFFIKSPPLPLFNNQSSWKRRHFVLSKSSKNGYLLLTYRKGHQKKGCIELNENSEIEIGIGDSERMASVKRMFKCQLSEVMTIKTEERTYYLIGTDSRQIEEWANFLFEACMGRETTTPMPIQSGSRNRSQSLPAFSEYVAAVDKEDLREGNECDDISADKKRPSSYSTPQEPTEESHIYEFPRKIGPCQRKLPSNHCECEDETKGKSEKEEEEEKEPYYASPRSILAKLDHLVAECSIPAENVSPNDTNDDKGVYMSMRKLVVKEKEQSTHASDELETLPQSQENSTDQKGIMDTQQLLDSNSRTKELPPQNQTKHLTVVRLSRLLNTITDDSQLEEVDILLPQNDALNCLTFTEAIGRICVSQWNAPPHLGCIFHHGDHIMAVNDVHVMSIDEILLFMKRSTKKEVKLTVRRLPDSDIFHDKGCMRKEKEQG